MIDGHQTLAAFEGKHGALPPTYETETSGGGLHRFYRTPIALPSRRLGPGLDFKAEGGFVVAAPSLHCSGRRYRWRTTLPDSVEELPELPSAIVDALRRPEAPARSSGTGQPSADGVPRWLPDRIPVGNRHRMLARFAGWLRGCGAEEPEILAHLRQVTEARCEQLRDDRISDRELVQIASNMARRPVGRRQLPELLERYAPVAAAWRGRNASIDRRIFLHAVLPIIAKAGTVTVHLAVRTVAATGVASVPVVARSLRRLASRFEEDAENRGVLELVRPHSEDGRLAAVYRLLPPPAQKAGNPDTLIGQEAGSGTLETLTPREGRSSYENVSVLPVSSAELALFRFLKSVASDVYRVLSIGSTARVIDLVVITGRSPRAVSNALRRLVSLGLATKTDEAWSRGPADAESLARDLGLLRQLDRDHARYRSEREDYRAPEAQSARTYAKRQRRTLRETVLDLAAQLGFPALGDMGASSESWAAFARQARRPQLEQAARLLWEYPRNANSRPILPSLRKTARRRVFGADRNTFAASGDTSRPKASIQSPGGCSSWARP